METQQTQNQGNALQPIENMVENDDGQMFTTSLIIAQAFEKEHKNVLRDIENLECSPEFYRLNFEPINYEAEIGRGGGKREFTAYRITRDGFAFLAMGFTGKKAAAWKEKFLEAFNAMERQLTNWAFVDKMPYISAEMALCTHFDVSKLDEAAGLPTGSRCEP